MTAANLADGEVIGHRQHRRRGSQTRPFPFDREHRAPSSVLPFNSYQAKLADPLACKHKWSRLPDQRPGKGRPWISTD
jgi:hypothetical protein